MYNLALFGRIKRYASNQMLGSRKFLTFCLDQLYFSSPVTQTSKSFSTIPSIFKYGLDAIKIAGVLREVRCADGERGDI